MNPKPTLLALAAFLAMAGHAEDSGTLATEIAPKAKRFSAAVAFGLPDLFAARLAAPVGGGWEVGAALGVLPATQIVDPLSGLKPQSISPEYEMELRPSFVLWAPQFFARWQPSGWSGAVTASLGVLLAQASARGTLHNLTSDARATVADVTATLTQPLLSVALEYPLASGDGWQLRGTLGAMFLFAPSVRAAATGLLPAFVATNPEAVDSYDDALATAERELTDTLGKWNGRPPVLPTVAIALAW